MDLIKCPICGEMYSGSYPRCPFCEEDGDDSRKIRLAPKRRILNRQKSQSARGGLIAVLVLVLALLSFYFFGDNILPRGGSAEEPGQTEQPAAPNVPASNPNASDDPFYQDPGTSGQPGDEPGGTEPSTVEPTPEPEPVPDENVDVSNAKLNRDDFTLSYAGEKFQVRVSGTEATPHWSIDNANVASISADGTVTAVANGDTKIHCKVGTRDLTCMVRVRNTGKTAAPSDGPTSAEPIVPAPPQITEPAQPETPQTTQPAAPSQTTPPAHVDASTLKLKTNFTGVLPKDGDTGKYDCTVTIGGDVIRLVVIDEDGKELSANWKSGDTSVATIAADGTVSPVASGRRTVMTGTVGDASIECIIRVR